MYRTAMCCLHGARPRDKRSLSVQAAGQYLNIAWETSAAFLLCVTWQLLARKLQVGLQN